MKIRLNAEQALAAERLTGPVLVTAGAGSGKTRMLTERFVNAVVPGRLSGWTAVDAVSVVAITYTEKAAGEISERVRTEISRSGLVEGGANEELWIATIHGFCSRILRHAPFEVGIDPLFSVVDALEAARLRERAFRDALTEMDGPDGRLRGLLDTWGTEPVYSAVLEIERQLGVAGFSSDAICLEPARSVSQLVEEAEALYSDGISTCDIDYTGTSSAHIEHSEQCRSLLADCSQLGSLDHSENATYERILEMADTYRPLKKLKDFHELAEEYTVRKEQLVARAAAAVALPQAITLRSLAAAYGRLYKQAKQDAGLLDFEDLQTKAVDLLETQPQIAAKYRERFKVVMIDEFQDTDALQLRLVSHVAGPNLCTVGDEMQAIYGFRGADVDVYRSHRGSMRSEGALVAQLATNYRSHPHILSFVNRVFGSAQYSKNETLPLNPAPDGRGVLPFDEVLGDSPRVEVLLVDAGDGSIGIARRREATEIADRLAELKGQGLDCGDVAVLVGAYTHAHVYANALIERGIPATIVGGGRFFGLAETAIMRALTRVIANVGDEAALGLLMVSDFVPVADEALLRLRLAAEGQRRPLWDLMRDAAPSLDPADREAIARLREVIERAQSRVGREPLEDVLLRAVEEAGYDLRLLAAQSGGRDALANVVKFARRAAEFERREGSGPAGFSAYLDAKERLGDREAPDTAVDEGVRSVQIMSIHASKGLEFPVVVVPDIGRKGRNNCDIVRTQRTQGELRVALKTPPREDTGVSRPGSEWFRAFDAADKAALEEERDRIFYVALTRARDLLLVSGSGKLNPQKSSAAKDDLVKLVRVLGYDVPIGGPRDEPITSEGEAGGRFRVIGCGQSTVEPPRQPETPAEEMPLAFAEPFRTKKERVWRPDSVSYTQFSEFKGCPRQFHIRRVWKIVPPAGAASSGSQPMRLGTALHTALRMVSPERTTPETARMSAIARYFELDADDAERLSEAVTNYCDSEVARRVEVAQAVMHEAPLSVAVGDNLFVLGGSIDLLARTGDRALIVDYKSGTSGSTEELSDRYLLQAECYAFAALRDGCQQVEVVFVRPEVVREGQVEQVRFEFGADDADGIEARLVARYREIQRSDYGPTPGPACINCDVPAGMCEYRRDSRHGEHPS